MTASIYTVVTDILGTRLGPAVLIRDNLGICYADDIPDGTPADGLALVLSDADLADFLHVVTVRMPEPTEPNVAWFEIESAPAGTPVAINDFTGIGNAIQAMRRAKRVLDGSTTGPPARTSSNRRVSGAMVRPVLLTPHSSGCDMLAGSAKHC